MGYFRWLHLSDLHFRMCGGFDLDLVLQRLREVLRKAAEDGKFRYVFLTGDLADCGDYSGVEQRIRELVLDNGILETGGEIFWVCGNHDIPRTLRHRKREIASIRDREQAAITFEREFADEESRELLLGAFKEYYAMREKLLKADRGGGYPHQVIHGGPAEIVLLNTCLTACDDEDEHRLYVCEPGLIRLFQEITPGKPVFALGHHSLGYLADVERTRLLSLFREKEVSVYLCGHSHRPGIQLLAENMREIVAGGFRVDGYTVLSFFVGIFDETRREYSVIPYVWHPGSMRWVRDYCAVWGAERGRRYPASHFPFA